MASSWLNIRDIDHLSPEEITEFLNTSHRKTGELRQGYEVAQNPKEWDAEQVEHRRGLEEAANEVDELEDEDELADTSAGKRKKAPKEKSKKKAKTSKVSLIRRGQLGSGQAGLKCQIESLFQYGMVEHTEMGEYRGNRLVRLEYGS